MSNGADARRALEGPVRQVELPVPVPAGDKSRVFVKPGTIRLGFPDKANAVRWMNNTGGSVEISLETVQDLLIPLNGEDLSQPIPIAAGDQLVVGVKDKDNLPAQCLRDYQVYCDAIGGYAEGDSSPHMGYP